MIMVAQSQKTASTPYFCTYFCVFVYGSQCAYRLVKATTI